MSKITSNYIYCGRPSICWTCELAEDYLGNYLLVSAKGVEQSIEDIINFWYNHYDYWPESIFSLAKTVEASSNEHI